MLCAGKISGFRVVIGAAITLFTGRTVLFSGSRQIVFGLAAAAVTYTVGRLVGVSLAG
jgi:VIT1/CCC1 family predicted Fe2+/Mn2+ transporter